uniref:Uncharacterized protein n=1 Tax=Physcomitrium patens TaxID=3218 RepID=A0A2K1JQ52_PHYPA|nr:hypothetical protein PHYPA_016052 [Physcomitrium patens]
MQRWLIIGQDRNNAIEVKGGLLQLSTIIIIFKCRLCTTAWLQAADLAISRNSSHPLPLPHQFISLPFT